ncbi:MAG TPA: glycosyltransferase, partial [Pyrinomonadaceae bacterium]
MIIGLDAIPLTETKTGVGHYTFELARALAAASPADEFELIYPSRYEPIDLRADDGSAPPPNLRATRVEVGSFGRHWWSVGLPRHLRRGRVDLFHGTNYDVPLWGGRPGVLTVHDLSAFVRPDTMLARRALRLRRRLPL